MKILILSYDFYPEGKPNTYRWFNIAKSWVNKGAEVYVVTADKNQYLAYEEIDGVKIYRTTEYFIGNLKYQYRESINNPIVESKIDNKGVKFFLKGLIRKIYNATWSNIYWPDHSFLWTFSAVPVASKIIEEHNIDKLITASWTFSAHRIGDKLKKKFPNLYWLADTIDPFCFNARVNNLFLYNRLNVSYENKIFKRADFNSVLTEKIKKKYVSLFPALEHKIGVNNNIFIPVEFDYSKTIENEKIRLLFLGTLSQATRSPKNLLVLLDNLLKKYPDIKIEIDFYGDFTDTKDEFAKYPELLSNYIHLNNFITREEVNKVIKNADILLNIGNSNEYQEPSKLIEYMYSSKKILNICTIENDTSAELLKQYPLSLSIYPGEINNDITLEKLITFFNGKEIVDRSKLREILKNYLLETVADKYLNFLSR
ncbi:MULTISPECIES: hypothetical protein [Flavobacterium]|uniref:Glycosyltransferase involved in cell wall biosynthesis n=1 Tax=Flavobacterium endoglycinae TaxID=2816357 RepID=A0ABX7Q9N9_9FLAO|nr:MULTISPECIES: hypothetical protein [Flavobacterium]QSW87460.1 hypothetical protein J0383_14315 [Flavobacterium endoglycinae]